MVREIKITDIQWDTDGDGTEGDAPVLPTTVVMEIDLPDDEDIDSDDIIADRLSKDYGFCVKSFGYHLGNDGLDEDGVLGIIADACQGSFGSVESVPGRVYVDDGAGNVFAVTVTKCENCEERG